jgi:hypothetical protein
MTPASADKTAYKTLTDTRKEPALMIAEHDFKKTLHLELPQYRDGAD